MRSRMIRLITLCSIFLIINGYGYSQNVTISVHDVSVQKVFREITRQTGMSIVYKESLLAGMSSVTIQVKDATPEAVLDLCLKGQPVGIQKVGKSIVIVALSPAGGSGVAGGAGVAGAAAHAVRGIVRSSANDVPLEGVTVTEKGTDNATRTSPDGSFRLRLSRPDAVLVFSSVGFKTVEVNVAGRSQVEVLLGTASQELSGVVVTALGITRAKRSLGYSVAQVDGKEFDNVPQENMLNALSGKVSGVTINSTGGTGSSVQMVIRGANSLSSDNQPLFVIDGVPLANTVNNVSEVGTDNRVDYGNALTSVNPEDIESVTILKGPSAAALYGSRAGNGVVLITTKTGRNAHKMTVSVTSNTVVDHPYKFLLWQTKFGPGSFSAIPTDISGTPLSNPFGSLIQESAFSTYGAELNKGYSAVQWNSPLDASGKPIPTPLISHKNNVKNFVQDGITSINDVAISSGNDQMNYRLAFSNLSNRGIIPNTDLYRNSLSLNTGIRVTRDLRLSSSIDFSRNNSNNRPAGERGTNPLQWAYNIAPNTDIRDLKDYWLPGQQGIQQKVPYKGAYDNPYFLAYEVRNSYNRDRLFGNLKADWQISPAFSFMARFALDTYNEKRETKISESYSQDPGGSYGITNLYTYESNADFLFSYKKELGNLSLLASAGGNTRLQSGSTVRNATKNGTGLIVPGVFNIQNILPANLDYSNTIYKKEVQSVYGLVNLGYKDMVYLDLTARNDWSSTLPGAKPYFYPSASLSLIMNDILGIRSEKIDLVKLRGGVAEVGNDASPYQLQTVLGNAGTWAGIPRLGTSGTLLNPVLKPELATSYEGGLDFNMYKNRLRLAATYYMSQNKNQIFSTQIPSSSGYTTKNINAGLLRSNGIELTIGGTPIVKKDLRWDVTVNFTRSRTRILELANGLPYFTLWTDAQGGAWTYIGDQVGDIYDAKMVTVTDKGSPYYGYPLLDVTGKWQTVSAINTKNKIGNFNPDFIMGMQSTITYKNFSLGFTLDWRNGGQFVSQTYRYGEEYGHSSLFYNGLINPGLKGGQNLRDYLVAHADKMILSSGNHFPLVGGPTPEYNGYPFVYGPYTLPYGGVFIPGVRASGFDASGNPTGYIENLGANINQPNGTAILPFAGATAWGFTRAYMYSASYIKLRELSVTYALPGRFVKKQKLQNASVSVYTRNVILWTAAKINVDPENAFQPSTDIQGSGTQFKQGIERYNVNPWVIPVGVKLNVIF